MSVNRIRNEPPSDGVNLIFCCKICNASLRSPFKDVSNLHKHLLKHEDYREWYQRYEKFMNKVNRCVIDKNMWCFLSYFISSNVSLNEMRNKTFIQLVSNTTKCPSYTQLRHKLLNSVLEKMFDIINIKLDQASSVTLITDLWTNNFKTRFIALAAACLNHDFTRELIVLDMSEISHTSSAENIQTEIENMVNRFNFDKSKIKGTDSVFKKKFIIKILLFQKRLWQMKVVTLLDCSNSLPPKKNLKFYDIRKTVR